MNLNEMNFSFAGKHCLNDFGMMYIEDDGHAISPRVRRNRYEIAGTSGSVLLPGAVYEPMPPFEGILVFMDEPNSQAEAQKQLRRVSAWLKGAGRAPLVFDYETEVYYLAEANSETVWDYKDWLGGALKVQFEAQPFALSSRPHQVSAQGAAEVFDMILTCETSVEAPINIAIKNMGAAPVTAVSAELAGRQVRLDGLNLALDQSLIITMEPPIGVAFGDGASAMSLVRRFETLAARNGRNDIKVSVSYGAGARSVGVRAWARGRFV